mgnify:CR=1 FL=1
MEAYTAGYDDKYIDTFFDNSVVWIINLQAAEAPDRSEPSDNALEHCPNSQCDEVPSETDNFCTECGQDLRSSVKRRRLE